MFLTHGDVPMTNNRCENAIRPFVVGRKGWLFSDTVKGAVASANLYSLVETCKANGVEPHAYLTLPVRATAASQDRRGLRGRAAMERRDHRAPLTTTGGPDLRQAGGYGAASGRVHERAAKACAGR